MVSIALIQVMLATAAVTNPITAQPLADLPMKHTIPPRSFYRQCWDYLAFDQTKASSSTRKDDCRALFNYIQSIEGNEKHQDTPYWTVADKIRQLARSGSCSFRVKGQICVPGTGSCNHQWPVRVGNGDIAVIVAKAVAHMGDDEHIAAIGSMTCYTETQPFSQGTMNVVWDIF
ncbi:hypothetical protein PG995_011091 [Apiospora arundinis]